MIDYEKIGQRIAEQRKYIRKISQERMAEDLGMYQADISNLEKAKKGSGITDLSKLQLIADYFEISLENLLFGKTKDIPTYVQGCKKLIHVKKKIKKPHRDILSKLTGIGAEKISGVSFECEPYSVYVLTEYQYMCGSGTQVFADGHVDNPKGILPKLHIFVLCGNEVICVAVADVTSTMQHVYEPALIELQQLIQMDILDVTDVLRTLNPYWALYRFSDEAQDELTYRKLMLQRMDEIRSLGDMNVLYIESVYVRKDYRQLGIFRMCIDVLRKVCGDCIMWLNMEPTIGSELTDEYYYFPMYTVSELGQLNLNSSIAERTGFTVDPDTWRRQAEVIDENGLIQTEVIRVRKCAYYLPKAVRKLLKNDGDLVAEGRALQHFKQKNEEGQSIVDFRSGEKDGFMIYEWSKKVISGSERGNVTCCYAAYQKENLEKHKFGVSFKSVFEHGLNHSGQREEYEYLDDAAESEFFDLLCMLNSFVLHHLSPAESDS